MFGFQAVPKTQFSLVPSFYQHEGSELLTLGVSKLLAPNLIAMATIIFKPKENSHFFIIGYSVSLAQDWAQSGC